MGALTDFWLIWSCFHASTVQNYSLLYLVGVWHNIAESVKPFWNMKQRQINGKKQPLLQTRIGESNLKITRHLGSATPGVSFHNVEYQAMDQELGIIELCHLHFLFHYQHHHLPLLHNLLLPNSHKQANQKGIIGCLLDMKTLILSLCSRSRKKTHIIKLHCTDAFVM